MTSHNFTSIKQPRLGWGHLEVRVSRKMCQCIRNSRQRR